MSRKNESEPWICEPINVQTATKADDAQQKEIFRQVVERAGTQAESAKFYAEMGTLGFESCEDGTLVKGGVTLLTPEGSRKYRNAHLRATSFALLRNLALRLKGCESNDIFEACYAAFLLGQSHTMYRAYVARGKNSGRDNLDAAFTKAIARWKSQNPNLTRKPQWKDIYPGHFVWSDNSNQPGDAHLRNKFSSWRSLHQGK